MLSHCGEGCIQRWPGPLAQPGGELANKVNQNAIKAAKADTAYLEGKLDTAKALLRDGVPLATVIRCTGLTEDQLAREMKKDSGV